jgi:hypothetical protein
VLNVTTNPPVLRPDITLNFPIEDSEKCDITAGLQHSIIISSASNSCWQFAFKLGPC